MPLMFSAIVDNNDGSIELVFAHFLASIKVSQHRCAEIIIAFLTMSAFPPLSGFYDCKS